MCFVRGDFYALAPYQGLDHTPPLQGGLSDPIFGQLPGVPNSQAHVRYAALTVALDQDVLCLDVTVSDGWLASGSGDLDMKVSQA